MTDIKIGAFYATKDRTIIKITQEIDEASDLYKVGYRFIGRDLVRGRNYEYFPDGRIYNTARNCYLDLGDEIQDHDPILLYGLKPITRLVFEIIAKEKRALSATDIARMVSMRRGKTLRTNNISQSIPPLILRRLVHRSLRPTPIFENQKDRTSLKATPSALKMVRKLNLT